MACMYGLHRFAGDLEQAYLIGQAEESQRYPTATTATITTGAGTRTDTIVGWHAQAWQHTGTRTTSNKTGDQELDGRAQAAMGCFEIRIAEIVPLLNSADNTNQRVCTGNHRNTSPNNLRRQSSERLSWKGDYTVVSTRPRSKTSTSHERFCLEGVCGSE